MASATLLSSARFIAASSVVFRTRPRSCRRPLPNGKGRMLDLRSRASFYPENLDPRQGLALQPFKEGAAGGRNIGEAVGHPGGVEGCHRIAAARDRYKLAGGRKFRRRLGDLDGADVERLELEGAQRSVPH